MTWPKGARAALSLSFDDARISQVSHGLPLLDLLGVRATFYVTVPTMQQRLGEWKAAVANGHEIGNHTLTHPCSCNFAFSRQNGLENYTLERLADDIDAADAEIHRLLGVSPTTFAYPCGQKFVGRGAATQSYVPLIAKRYKLGRGFRDESSNDPQFFDPAQAYGVDMDQASLDDLRPLLDSTIAQGSWLILAGHDVGAVNSRQVTLVQTLEQLSRFCADNGVWINTVDAVVSHILRGKHA